MKACGIITEYNPFHNGHRYQIETLRDMGMTHIAAVMSGHITQRGDIACFSKYARAKAAVLSGCDLVLELPTVFSCASAERFALGGTFILNALPDITHLAFGAETPDASLLTGCAKACLSIAQSAPMRSLLKQGLSYPAARMAAVSEIYGEKTASVLRSPNNTLGVEYIKAILSNDQRLAPLPLPRTTAHDGGLPDGKHASASHLRTLSKTSLEAIKPFVPESAFSVYLEERSAGRGPVFSSAMENAILVRLKTTAKESFKSLPDVSEGLENRLYSSAKKASCLDGFYGAAKTKRYTLSRLRRIVWYLMLGITKADLSPIPGYARVLAANSRGFELLHNIPKESRVLISPGFKHISKRFPRETELDRMATDLFSLLNDPPRQGALDFFEHLYFHK